MLQKHFDAACWSIDSTWIRVYSWFVFISETITIGCFSSERSDRRDGSPPQPELPVAGAPLAFLGGVAETPSRPPLTLRTSPVIQLAAGLQRKATP